MKADVGFLFPHFFCFFVLYGASWQRRHNLGSIKSSLLNWAKTKDASQRRKSQWLNAFMLKLGVDRKKLARWVMCVYIVDLCASVCDRRKRSEMIKESTSVSSRCHLSCVVTGKWLERGRRRQMASLCTCFESLKNSATLCFASHTIAQLFISTANVFAASIQSK